jgi:multidrug transporter EmrE-like cation transporter
MNPTALLPILIILLSTVISNASYFLQLEGAKGLPASVLYPMITGGSVVLSGIFALVFFGEKLSKREWISIALCLAGTCMFL